jgi:hypothetical protein
MLAQKLFTGEDKIPKGNSIYAHAQDFALSDELLLAIIKEFVPQPLHRQQTNRLSRVYVHLASLNRLLSNL